MATSAPVILNRTTEALIFQFPTSGAEDHPFLGLIYSNGGPSYDWPIIHTDGSGISRYVDICRQGYNPEGSFPGRVGGMSGQFAAPGFLGWSDLREVDANPIPVLLSTSIPEDRKLKWQDVFNGTDNDAGWIQMPVSETKGTAYSGYWKFPPRQKKLIPFTISASYWQIWGEIVGAPPSTYSWTLSKLGGGYSAHSGDPKGWSVTPNHSAMTFNVTAPYEMPGGLFRVQSDGAYGAHGHPHLYRAIFEIPCLDVTVTSTPLP